MIATVPERGSLAEHGIDVRGRIYWHPTTSQLYAHALARGDATLAEGGPLVVDTGVPHRPLAEGQVHRPRAWLGGADLVGRRERRDLGGVVRATARQGRGGARKRRRLRRRCVRGRRPCSPHCRAGAHRQPLARALREDAVHRSLARGARADGDRRARPACAGGRGGSRGGRHAERVPSSFSIRRVPRW